MSINADNRAIQPTRWVSYAHKITETVTKERLVKAAFVASTVALASLSLYAPILFTIGSIGLGIANAISFSSAVQKWTPLGTLKCAPG